MTPVAPAPPLGISKYERIESWFSRVLIVLSVIAAIGLCCRLGILIWAQNEFTQPESVVAAQSMMLARDGTLYYDLNSYPHTVAAYTPVLYWLEAGGSKLGIATFLVGRLVSFGAMLGLFALVWRLIILYTGDRRYAWTGAVLCASSALLSYWCSVGQTDTLAVFFAVAAFYHFSRYYIGGEDGLVWAGVFAIAAFFTKQTAIASPAAIFLLLWFHRRKLALQFGASVGGIILVLALAINKALDGRFVADTVFANMNPLALAKLTEHLEYLSIAAGQLILIAAAGFRSAWRGRGRALFVYLGIVTAVFTATSPKIGSDSNYQIELTIALILCSCVALHSLDFLALTFRGSKAWITLLQIPLAVHLIMNYRIAGPNLFGSIEMEQKFRSQIAALRPYFSGDARVISTDVNAVARLHGRIDVEPLIYTYIVGAGIVDPEPLRRDVAAEAFSTIVLYEDVNYPDPSKDREFPSLPPAQLEEIRRHYRLVARIPGPYLGGAYVYKPGTTR